MKTKTIHLLSIFAFVLGVGMAAGFADEPIWTAERAHFGAGQDEWVIHPAAEPTTPVRLSDALKSVYQQDHLPVIRHIAVGSLYQRPDIQKEVMDYLQEQEVFRQSPPPYEKNKWDFENSGKLQKVVSDALLQSKFVGSLNLELSQYGWKINSVSMEKLYFTKEKETPVWHAIVWLNLVKGKYQSKGN